MLPLLSRKGTITGPRRYRERYLATAWRAGRHRTRGIVRHSFVRFAPENRDFSFSKGTERTEDRISLSTRLSLLLGWPRKHWRFERELPTRASEKTRAHSPRSLNWRENVGPFTSPNRRFCRGKRDSWRSLPQRMILNDCMAGGEAFELIGPFATVSRVSRRKTAISRFSRELTELGAGFLCPQS
jgi:hypothetical protein